MQRNRMDRRKDPRQGAERDATQPIAGQPRDDEEEDLLQEPESVPNFLTARELQARAPARPEADPDHGEADPDDGEERAEGPQRKGGGKGPGRPQ